MEKSNTETSTTASVSQPAAIRDAIAAQQSWFAISTEPLETAMQALRRDLVRVMEADRTMPHTMRVDVAHATDKLRRGLLPPRDGLRVIELIRTRRICEIARAARAAGAA